MKIKSLNLGNIQGNILGGFKKDFEDFLFLKFTTARKGRAWIKEIVDPKFEMGVASSSSEDVLRFNAQFNALRARGIKPETVIKAEWTNLAISFQGLKALRIAAHSLAKFPKPFRDGMAARKDEIGDLGESHPNKWIAPFGSQDVHALLIVAADSERELMDRVRVITNTIVFKDGVRVLLREKGRTRPDKRGHEHFGFKDGISQPGIRGVTRSDDPVGNPNQGHPGQQLLWPGEFVLGYRTQKAKHKPGVAGPNPDPGSVSKSGPAWTTDGSYLVFRRLAQDVPGFQNYLKALASVYGLSEDLTAAKLVGRYKSGCPLETREFQSTPSAAETSDPGLAAPQLSDSDTLNNNFRFRHDVNGARCPLSAHIRRAYPRDGRVMSSSTDNDSEVEKHRLLRRGIPFGAPLGASYRGAATDPRGLLFLAYQKDIKNHFEFVQRNWINNPNFPAFPKGLATGQDPIAAQSPRGPFQLNPNNPNIIVQHFVKMTGGEYFFAPSIDALQKIGDNKL